MRSTFLVCVVCNANGSASRFLYGHILSNDAQEWMPAKWLSLAFQNASGRSWLGLLHLWDSSCLHCVIKENVFLPEPFLFRLPSFSVRKIAQRRRKSTSFCIIVISQITGYFDILNR